MQKTIDVKVTKSQAAQIDALLGKYSESLKQIFKQMKKDQAEIEKIGARTRARLARLKAA